jgi:hypothetical protein
MCSSDRRKEDCTMDGELEVSRRTLMGTEGLLGVHLEVNNDKK